MNTQTTIPTTGGYVLCIAENRETWALESRRIPASDAPTAADIVAAWGYLYPASTHRVDTWYVPARLITERAESVRLSPEWRVPA